MKHSKSSLKIQDKTYRRLHLSSQYEHGLNTGNEFVRAEVKSNSVYQKLFVPNVTRTIVES